jgi:membrane protein DedA with SNARE-associated domain
MDWVLEHAAQYGYAGIFFALVLGIVGLPIPDETLMVFFGYLISTGRIHPAGAFFSALAGTWCGISVSYWIGRTLGIGVVHRFGKYLHITDQKLESVHRWFDRTGHWALLIGYFIAGVRHFTAIVAGASKLSFPSFMAYAWTGGFLWVSTFLTLGYFLGENWRKVAESIHEYVLEGSIVLIVAGAAYYWWRSRSKMRS